MDLDTTINFIGLGYLNNASMLANSRPSSNKEEITDKNLVTTAFWQPSAPKQLKDNNNENKENNRETLMKAAYEYYENTQHEKALDIVKKISQLSDPKLLYQRALIYTANGDFDSAIEDLNYILNTLKVDHRDYRLFKARLLLDSGFKNDALDEIAIMLEQNPNDKGANSLLEEIKISQDMLANK